MNPSPKDTVTSTSGQSRTIMKVCDSNISSLREESTPVARKRRMTEQLSSSNTSKAPRRGFELDEELSLEESRNEIDYEDNEKIIRKPPMHPDLPRKRVLELNKRDDSSRLRKTIQWLEEGGKKLREDLAEVRSELHEERRASRMMKKDILFAVREARSLEAAKYQTIISELKTKISELMENSNIQLTSKRNSEVRAVFIKNDNYKREISSAKKRLVENDETIKKLKSNSIDSVVGNNSLKRRKLDGPDFKRMENEIRNLRQANKHLEDKLQTVIEAEQSRTAELRVVYEKHEAEMNALKKALRSETIKMMDEIKSKERENEKLEKIIKKMKSNNSSISKDELVRSD
jgi:hypothetical protein